MLTFIILIMIIVLLFYVISNQKAQKNDREEIKEVTTGPINGKENFEFKISSINDFVNIKTLLNDKYFSYGYSKVQMDNDKKYYLSNIDGSKGYMELSVSNDLICNVAAFRLGESFDKSIFVDYMPSEKKQVNVNLGDNSIADELLKLAELKEKGLLNDDEFNAQKVKILA